MILEVFTTSRNIRDFSNATKEGFIPKALSLGEFEKRAVVVCGKKQAAPELRSILLHKACKFDNFEKLNIPGEFFAFLSCEDYIFRFLEELSLEKKDFKDLQSADLYAEFSEHLEILSLVKSNYLHLLDTYKLYDNISLPYEYSLNSDYIKNFSCINIHIEGFLSEFECELLEQIAKITTCKLYLNTSKYNKKMLTRLDEKLLKHERSQIIYDLSQKSFTSQKNDKNLDLITHKSFELRSLQVGYIYQKIYQFIAKGFAPEDIAIILPDESFVSILKALDFQHNFNFAMGFSFCESLTYAKLDSINEALSQNSSSSRARLKKLNMQEYLPQIAKLWDQIIDFSSFKDMILSINIQANFQEQKIFENELFYLERLLGGEKLYFKQLYKFFLKRLSLSKIDDTNGGRISVLGILETRGMTYKGVIICDFNDEFVPHVSQKDMFLSSKLRAFASLPSQKDREDLQRYYYDELIFKAKEVAICYLENEESMASRFLSEFDSTLDDENDALDYMWALKSKRDINQRVKIQSISFKNNIFQKPLSPSRLKCLLSNPWEYYFKYILNIDQEDIPKDDTDHLDVGNYLHKALQELYQTNDETIFSSEEKLYKNICNLLDQIEQKDVNWQFEKKVYKRYLRKFVKLEIEEFQKGWRPWKFEKKFQAKFEDIFIEGKIDRIDRHQNGDLRVIDYKTGKINNQKLEQMTDFQMEFYAILLEENLLKNSENKLHGAFRYYLKHAQMIKEEDLEIKIDKLKECIKALKQEDVFTFDLLSEPKAPFNFDRAKMEEYSKYKILEGIE